MSKTVKLADVARAAGVSQGTVSNVFNRPALVSDELRGKVEEAARMLGYRGPDPRGRLLRAGRVNAVGVVSSGDLPHFFSDPYMRAFLTGVAQSCQARGAGLALVSAMDDEMAAWNIRTALVDGLILNCLADGSRLVELARQRGLPFVAVDFHTDADADSIEIDDRSGARLAVQHLVGLGHRHLAILAMDVGNGQKPGPVGSTDIAGIRYEVVRRRIAGYAGAADEAGLPPLPIYASGTERAAVAAGIEAILASHPETTGFLCMCDTIALACCQHLARMGISVPADMSVIGFDGTEEAACFSPSITSIGQPMEEKGAAAVDMILGSLATSEKPRVVRLPVTLLAGASTAPPRHSP